MRKPLFHPLGPVLCPHLDVHSLIEPIHLIQQLHENALDFAVSTGLGIETGRGDRINLMPVGQMGQGSWHVWLPPKNSRDQPR